MFQVKGYDFNEGVDYHALLQSYKYILRLPGDQLWPRRRGDQQDDQQEVCSSFKTSLVYLLSHIYREEPIPEEKRESCANTELGPEVKNTIQSIPDVSGLSLAKCR